MPLPERVRVKSKQTGHEFTRSSAWYEANKDAVTLLDNKSATHLDGTDVPMKPRESIAAAGQRRTGGKRAAAKRTTKKTAARATSGSTSEAGTSAATPKENS